MNLHLSDRGRLVAALAFVLAAAWALMSLANWSDLANGVRVGIAWTTYGYGQHLLLDGPVQAAPVFGALVLNLCAAMIGYALVIRPLWGGHRLAPEVWLFLAGHIPGTLLLIALNRVVTLFLPNATAPIVLMGAIVAGALAALVLSVRAGATRPASGLRWSDVWLALAVFLAVLVFSVHIDRGHVLGEGSVWFINDVFLSPDHGITAAGRWPLVSQHYDEAAFLYPAVYGLLAPGADASGTLTFVYWLTLAFGRIGICSAIYIGLRALRLDRLSALVVLVFVCGASLSVNAVSSRLLFDSLSPLAETLHIARFLTPVLPFLLVAGLAGFEGRASPAALAVTVVLGLGLSSMPIQLVMILPWAIVLAVVAAVSPGAARTAGFWRSAAAVCILVLVALSLAYGLQSAAAPVRVAVLMASAAAGAALIAWALLRSGGIGWSARGWPAPALLVALCLGYGLGLLLLGNIFAGTAMKVLGGVWPWSDLGVAERIYSKLGTSSWALMQSPYCEGYWWGHRELAGHCGSLSMFARTYGLAFVVMTAVVAWWLWRTPRADGADRELTMTASGIVLCLLAMPPGFVLFDFLSPMHSEYEWQEQLSVWLRSRLLEPWFYSGIILALVLFLREASARGRRLAQSAMLVATAVYAMSPLIGPAQIVVNAAYLFDSLLPR